MDLVSFYFSLFSYFSFWFYFTFLYFGLRQKYGEYCHMQVHPSGNYIPTVILFPNHTSLPFMMITFLATHLMAVLQPPRYSIFHDGDTPIQLSLSWQSYSYQCLNTKTSAQGNRSFTTKTLSISYTIWLYIRLVVTL